jgi:hypothetical protein
MPHCTLGIWLELTCWINLGFIIQLMPEQVVVRYHTMVVVESTVQEGGVVQWYHVYTASDRLVDCITYLLTYMAWV